MAAKHDDTVSEKGEAKWRDGSLLTKDTTTTRSKEEQQQQQQHPIDAGNGNDQRELVNDDEHDVDRIFRKLSEQPAHAQYPELMDLCRPIVQLWYDTYADTMPTFWKRLRRSRTAIDLCETIIPIRRKGLRMMKVALPPLYIVDRRYFLRPIIRTAAIHHAFLFVIVLLSLPRRQAVAFSAPNPNSPWKPASWQIVLNIGREPSSTLPDEWGKSGARLFLPLKVLAESERLPDHQQDPLLGRGANRLVVVGDDKAAATYVNEKGEQSVSILSGGWKLRLGQKKGHASLLRFWLDVGSCGDSSSAVGKKIVAQKNDVTLQANERLYFAALCWRQAEYELGRKKLQPLVEAYERAQSKVEEQVDHDRGDRRLDGNDALETLAAYKDMAGLTLDRNEKRRQLQEAQEHLPPPEQLPFGNWPGSTELIALKPMEVFVQRRKGIFPSEDHHLIGTWKSKPLGVIPEEKEETLFARESESEEADGDDDDWEYYDDEDDENNDDENEYEYYEEEENVVDDGPRTSREVDFDIQNDGPIQRPD